MSVPGEVESNAVEVAGERLDLRPLPVGKIARMMSHLRPVLRVCSELDESGCSVTHLALVERCEADLSAAVAVAVDRPVEWVGALTTTEHLTLITAAIDANRDFVAQLLQEEPQLLSMASRLTTAPTSSAGSSMPDTPAVDIVATANSGPATAPEAAGSSA